MSSFYQRPTSAQQPAFQFDRVYTSRKELEENFDKDGVMVGRYVMVTYGSVQPHLAYAQTNDQGQLLGWYMLITRDNDGTPKYDRRITEFVDGDIYENVVSYDLAGKYWYYKDSMWYKANEDMTHLTPQDPAYEYLTNLFTDIRAGYVPCPNSVFIKLYSKDKRGYYYKEIASLNEYLPSLDLVMEAPTCSAYEENWPEDLRVGDQSLQSPFIYKTGLHYNIHLVQPAIFVPGTEMHYNEAGFSESAHVVETHTTEETLKKRGIYYEDERKRWFPYNASSLNPGTTQEDPAQHQRTDRFAVQANFYELGNAVAAMWDKIYGTPSQLTSTTTNGIKLERGTRDTQINTSYANYRAAQAQNATQGKEDQESIRGIMNTVLKLVGYDERTTNDPSDYTEENCYLKTNNVIFDQNGNLVYWNPDAAEEARRVKFNRETLRGLIAEGAANAEKIAELENTLSQSQELLTAIQGLLGTEVDEEGNQIVWPDEATIHAIVNYILGVLADAETWIGHEDDTANDGTLWGMYNTLMETPVAGIIDLIGAAERPQGQDTILERLADLETRMEAQEGKNDFWVAAESGVIAPGDNISEVRIQRQKLTATNTQNKVRGAMWSD